MKTNEITKLNIGDKVSLKGYRNRLFGTVVEVIPYPFGVYVKTKPIKKQFANGGYNFNYSTDLVIYKTMKEQLNK